MMKKLNESASRTADRLESKLPADGGECGAVISHELISTTIDHLRGFADLPECQMPKGAS